MTQLRNRSFVSSIMVLGISIFEVICAALVYVRIASNVLAGDLSRSIRAYKGNSAYTESLSIKRHVLLEGCERLSSREKGIVVQI